MTVGYVRVSTKEQNEARQLEALNDCEKLFVDKQSGKDTSRPQLQEMLGFVREGDTVKVVDYSRLARSTKDLLNLVQTLSEKGVRLISLKENLDTSTPQGRLMLTVFAGLAEFEREVMLERQREGIAIAKAEGKYKGRKPIQFDHVRFQHECAKWRSGEQTAKVTMKKFGMKPNTFYRRVQELKF